MTLQRLIAPYTIEEFIASYWEQTFLHVSRDENPNLANDFASLISIDDIDALLTTLCAAGPFKWDAIRLSQNGTPIPPGEFQSQIGSGVARFHVDRILALYRQGATLIVNAVHDTIVPIAHLCNDLAAFFGVRVQANVYITPPSRQGFPAHHDHHDVFLLQILGEKVWRLYGSPVPLSRWPDQGLSTGSQDDAVAELPLRAGEVLYIPRGLVHEGHASDQTSFHITVGIHPYPWAQLLKDAITELDRDDVAFRRSVAPQLSVAGDGDSFAQTIRELTERLHDPRRLARIARDTARMVRVEARVPARGQFRQIVEPPPVTLSTWVKRVEGASVEIFAYDDEVVVASHDKVISLPPFVLPQVRSLVSGEPICAADLPSGLDDAGKLVLVQRFTREGIVEPYPTADTRPPSLVDGGSTKREP